MSLAASADGTEVAVDGMRDGTCDRLHLAPRLRSVEGWRGAGALSIIYDDLPIAAYEIGAGALMRLLATAPEPHAGDRVRSATTST